MKLSEIVPTQADLDRFWKYVQKNGPDDCWPWIGASWETTRYGMFSLGSRSWGAHRVALLIQLGENFKDDLESCHTCDNPPCVNPSHLFQGTHSQNIRDAQRKGHRDAAGFGKGMTHPYAKLTDLEIECIRSSRLLQRELSAVFQVSQQTISKIQNGKRWVHV